jgi:5'-nucleotidase
LNILLSNDDGIHSPGLLTLANILAREHTITIAAPDRERSAAGHSLTLFKPLTAKPVDLPNIQSAWAINGTPSDCIKIAFRALIDSPPDLVISGINRGPNLGTDVLYSGTVSAALEAVIQGVPAIATSLAVFGIDEYTAPSNYLLNLIRHLDVKTLPPKWLINVNFPHLPNSDYQGTRYTKLGVRKYEDNLEERISPLGERHYWLVGNPIEKDEAPDSDVVAIQNGFVSITALHYDMTDWDRTQNLPSLLHLLQ